MENKKVAIIFFGLTRALGKVIDSLKKNLFAPLDEGLIHYDVFIHTYKIFGPYNNIWSGENTDNYENEDVENLLNPKYYISDDQEIIANNINYDDYYKKLGCWELGYTPDLTKYLIKNLCLALYSKKQITQIFDEHKDEYDYAIIIRPDTELYTRINVNDFTELNDNNIIIPAQDWYCGGCNDRICIGTPNIISYYGKLFDGLKTYSENKSIASELYLFDKLNEKHIHIITKDIYYRNVRS